GQPLAIGAHGRTRVRSRPCRDVATFRSGRLVGLRGRGLVHLVVPIAGRREQCLRVTRELATRQRVVGMAQSRQWDVRVDRDSSRALVSIRQCYLGSYRPTTRNARSIPITIGERDEPECCVGDALANVDRRWPRTW